MSALALTALAPAVAAGPGDEKPKTTNDWKGNNLKELTEAWWQWAMSIPLSTAVYKDTDNLKLDGYCAVGQHGPVWFLPADLVLTPDPQGNYHEETYCTLPESKAALIPVAFCKLNFFEVPGATIEELREMCAAAVEDACGLESKLDGQIVTKFDRVKTGLFDLSLPNSPDNIYAIWELTSPSVIDPVVADGLWVLLKPLSPGSHILELNGESCSGGGHSTGFYYLEVVEEPKVKD